MAKRGLIAILALFCFCAGVRANDTTSVKMEQKWKISCSGYFQISYSYSMMENSFNIGHSKLILKGESGKKFSLGVELRPVNGNPLIKAYLGYRISLLTTVFLGQIPNLIKWVEPEPEEHRFASYALYQHYVANPDDIGLAVYRKNEKNKFFTYYGCIINGTGRNVPDNNQTKDLSGYVSFAPFSFFRVAMAGQTGMQPDGLRRAGFVRCMLIPSKAVEIQLASMGRTDLKEWGWYSSGSYFFPKTSLNLRVHQVTLGNGLNWTASIQTEIDDLKFTIETNTDIQENLGFALVVQLYLNKKTDD